jgi:hypothetical protein
MSKDDRIYEDACCIIGFKEGAPIWKKVGVKTKTKASGKDVILLDRTFNPAGCPIDEHSKTSVPIYFFKQDTPEEKENKRNKRTAPPAKYADFEDDIPF